MNSYCSTTFIQLITFSAHMCFGIWRYNLNSCSAELFWTRLSWLAACCNFTLRFSCHWTWKVKVYQIWWCQRLCDWTFLLCWPPRKPDIECSMNNVIVRWCFIMCNNLLFTSFPLQKSELLHYVKINVSSDFGPSKHSTTLLWSRQHWTTNFGTETHTLQLAQTPSVNLYSGSLQFV